MENDLYEIFSFHCPRWNELPEEPLLNSELVDYICETLDPIMNGKRAITQTMIQNYSKWKIIPRLKGRKYERKHISILIIICIYKQVININQLKRGLKLQQNQMSLSESYDHFTEVLEVTLKRIFSFVKRNDNLYFKEYESKKGLEGITVVSNAFALKLLSEIIIQNNGFEKLRSKK
ncbi:MAG: DUF1836 domain-containing protein [Peptoniphilaceae bacterium]